MMKFHQIKFQNFMPYKGNDHHIIFPTDSHRNILLIHGSNTYGKTSILRGIKWGLYGRVFDKRNHQFLFTDLLNWTAYDEKDFEMEVAIRFEANNNNYILTRHLSSKPNLDLPKYDSDFDVKTFLEKNGSNMSGADIEHEISLIAPEPVSRFFLFDGELLQEYQELLEDGSEVGTKIKESIEQILGVPALINGRNDTATLLKEYQKKQKSELSKFQSIKELANSRDEIEVKMEQSQSEILELRKQIDDIQDKKSNIENSVKDIEQKSRVAKDLDRTREKIKLLKNSIQELEVMKLEAASKAWKVLLRAKLYQVQKTSVSNLSEVIDKFEKVGTFKNDIASLNSILENGKCDLCGSETPADKKTIQDKISKLKDSLDSISLNNNLFSKITNQYEIVNSLLKDNQERSLKDIDQDLSSKYVELTGQETAEEDLKEKGGFSNTDEIRKNYESLGKLTQLNSDIERQIRDLNSKGEALSNQMSLITKMIEENPESNDSPTTKYVSIYNNINELFKDSIVNLRDKLKGEVEKKASEAFLELVHRKAYKSLKINDSYGLTIVDLNDKQVNIPSSGAEQIVALSLIDALARTGRSSGPVVMDTPFGRLDPKHRKNIVQYLPKTSSQLVLFVHAGETDPEMLSIIADRIGGEYEIKLQDDQTNSMIEKLR